jgi:hypothetical protein
MAAAAMVSKVVSSFKRSSCFCWCLRWEREDEEEEEGRKEGRKVGGGACSGEGTKTGAVTARGNKGQSVWERQYHDNTYFLPENNQRNQKKPTTTTTPGLASFPSFAYVVLLFSSPLVSARRFSSSSRSFRDFLPLFVVCCKESSF